ncbi:hypothetical protein CVD25_19080 [Bacillus canaveralius]|uniref:Uncharacterized protein n=1 Tax=Bacillus canaveralius TaxID=1403243 RepID=A0A2N5GFN6_9BACI|nr:hypothetical protein [Bacillus canaveralius]PLR79567.1 hypothetical protein CU635_22420 [Bacillus canaveralius]PLR91684.1 hypothetical protein CVD25_19080 [Bacillus canaveralius]RSK53279.1 hypothetical protein EJA13_08905 [Bacillus canaveralius]
MTKGDVFLHYHEYNQSYPQNQMNRQQYEYPPVDVSTFTHSVTAFQKIANEASAILQKLADRRFAHSLMAAAQVGNQSEVDRLIKSIGTTTPVTTTYTPTGVLLTIHAQAQGSQCCTLTMFLKWGQ